MFVAPMAPVDRGNLCPSSHISNMATVYASIHDIHHTPTAGKGRQEYKNE